MRRELLYQKSRFFENLFEHRFLFDICRHIVLHRKSRLVNTLRAEVDAFGFDIVLSVGSRSVHIQMKTRSGAPPSNAYQLSEQLWSLPDACALWMLYDPKSLEPRSYNLLGFPLPPMKKFKKAKRRGYRMVKMQNANHTLLKVGDIAELLFPDLRPTSASSRRASLRSARG